MATLTVTATEDYSDGNPPLSNITDIVFTNGASATATFNASQFNGTTISTSVSIVGNANPNLITIKVGNNETFTGAGFTFTDFGPGDSFTFQGTSGSETIVGTTQRDVYFGSDGIDNVSLGIGQDLAVLGIGSFDAGEVLDAGAGSDTLNLSNDAFLFILGTLSGFEELNFSDGTNSVAVFTAQQFASFTVVSAGGGNNGIVVIGPDIDLSQLNLNNWNLAGTDTIVLDGGDAGATVVGSEEDDTILGGDGKDVLDGGPGGDDTMLGGLGNDTYVFHGAADFASELGGGGTDLVRSEVDFSLADAARIGGDVENLTLIGAALVGTGNGLANRLTGNAGANLLDGGAANDTLRGLTGTDTLTGGGDKDDFVFESALTAANVDHITDFVHKIDDVVVDRSVFKGLRLGNLDRDAFVSGRNVDEAADREDRFIYDTKTGELFFDRDGTGNKDAKLFAILDGSPDDISQKDFVVIA